MDALLSSTALVALAEIGDKTQLLALLLAARFRKPAAIVAGILLATLANHALAAWLGASAATWLEGPWFGAVVALGFIAMGLWTLVPDKLDEDEAPRSGRSAFMTTLVSFFLVEIGDKTQIATIALGARYGDVLTIHSTVAWVKAKTFRMEHTISVGDRLCASGFEIRAWVGRPRTPGERLHARALPAEVAAKLRGETA